LTPDQVLQDIMTIFTFVGTALVRHDDSYSFQIIAKIIENVIPKLTKGKETDEELIPILRVFTSIILNVPEHRRLMLYVKLLTTLEAEKYLWLFIAVLLEQHVVQHQKGPVQENIPARMQFGLAIAKEFDLKCITMSATSLIVYLMQLPAAIDPNVGKTKTNEKESEKKIFCLKSHSNSQLRHYKYAVSLFLKNLLELPEVVNKAAAMSSTMTQDMKGQFSDLILNTLTAVPAFTKGLEQKQHQTIQIILQNFFDILEATIALLAPDMFLVVVENLMLYEQLLLRKKVLELFNKKVEEDYFGNCESEKVLKLLTPLSELCSNIGKEKSSSVGVDVVQQLALVSIKLLTKTLSDESPNDFVEILKKLCDVFESERVIKTSVLVNLIMSISELISSLKVRAIGMLGKIMPNIIKLLTLRDDSHSAFLVLYAAASAVLKMIEKIPHFLSPYIAQIIEQIVKISPALSLVNHDSKVTLTIGKFSKIWTASAENIPARVIIPAIEYVYDRIVEKNFYASLDSLMQLLCEIFQHSRDVLEFQSELIDFFLAKALTFRCNVSIDEHLNFDKINEIELQIVRALVALVLKLKEAKFRIFFENIFKWAIVEETNNYERAITFYRVAKELSSTLQFLFLPFASDIINTVGETLKSISSAKINENCCNDKLLIDLVLTTINNILKFDQENYMNSQRFEKIMQPIVDQIENKIVLKNDDIKDLLTSTIVMLSFNTCDDVLRKQLNYQVLLKTRSESPEIRIYSLHICVEIAKKITDNFEPLIPETIPFLSETLEDENYDVVKACQNSVRELESILGESLQKFF
jgi:U3 small nucleolar RNA-associated protein 10